MSTQYPMARVKLDGLDHTPRFTAFITRDYRDPDRVFLSMPTKSSLTEAQVLALCDALTDVLEAPQELAQQQPPAA